MTAPRPAETRSAGDRSTTSGDRSRMSAYVAGGGGIALAAAAGVLLKSGPYGTVGALIVMALIGYGYGLWDAHTDGHGTRAIRWCRESAQDLRRAFTRGGGAHE